MAKLSTWVRKHLMLRSGREKQHPVHPPLLSLPRRPITPTSFDTPACLLFRLPYDVRSMILSMAFGGRTFHVDVVPQERTWRWRGGECFQNGPERPPSTWYGWLGPWYDACTEEMERCVRMGKISDAHDIGVMGFLLSCRQAYTEGINVLYAANCISIKTEPLLLHLSKHIPHNRLVSITSLEIVVEAHRVEQQNGRQPYKLDHLESILDNIVMHCRQLRRLCLSLIVWQRHGHDLLTGPALPFLDAFWRTTQLRNMRVDLPARDYWEVRTSEPMPDHPREAPIKILLGTSLWRCLDSEELQVHRRSVERYPCPPFKMPVLDGADESEESSGYWLCEGHEELHPGYHNCGVR